MCKWIHESNREKHFIFAIPIGFFLTILCVLGCAFGMEFKDVQYHHGDWKAWDWLDWTATMIGGLIGQALQIGVVLLLYYSA